MQIHEIEAAFAEALQLPSCEIDNFKKIKENWLKLTSKPSEENFKKILEFCHSCSVKDVAGGSQPGFLHLNHILADFQNYGANLEYTNLSLSLRRTSFKTQLQSLDSKCSAR